MTRDVMSRGTFAFLETLGMRHDTLKQLLISL